MKKSEMKEYRKVLQMLQARLQGDVSQLADAALGGGSETGGVPVHMADIGSDIYEQDFALSLMENEEEMLDEIQNAIQRIEEGTYGTCEECEKAIPKARLQAIPYTSLCVACQRQLEEES